MSGFKSLFRFPFQSVKLTNSLRAASLLLLAAVSLMIDQTPASNAVASQTLPQPATTKIQTVNATQNQLAENPLTNFDWNTSLSKPAFRRIRFNERYGGCC